MAAPTGVSAAQDQLVLMVQSLDKANTSLQFKAGWLKQHRASDQIQQMQSDAIVDLCDVVRQSQQAIATLPTIIPRTGASGAPTTTSGPPDDWKK